MSKVKLRVKHISQIFQNLVTKKSPGSNEIPVNVLKNCIPQLAPLVSRHHYYKSLPKIFQLSFLTLNFLIITSSQYILYWVRKWKKLLFILSYY